MSLGSSIGNFNRHEAANFLRSFSKALQPSDFFLIGLDATNDSKKVYHAYNDREGLTHEFVLNGLLHANRVLGEKIFDLKDWKVIGEYIYDCEGGRHQAFYSPSRNVQFKDVCFKAGERVQVEQSLKYSSQDAAQLWDAVGLKEIGRWSASSDAYNIHLLENKKMPFSLDPTIYSASVIPTLDEWKELWKIWDVVTRDMLPDEELLDKPIKLRNACIFYLGHIPTFLDIHLSRVTQTPFSEPQYYPKIFERGIDPDVDNPEHCHSHSEIPDQWPPLEEILAYQNTVRERVRKLYENGVGSISRKLGRSLWVAFEHEIMHLETLLYMLLQSDRTLPPTPLSPDFESEAKRAEKARVPNQWFQIPDQTITIGLDDPEDNSRHSHYGWDNEKPPRKVHVKSFTAKGRPITNEEYARFLQNTHNSKIPASWLEEVSQNGSSNGYTNGHVNGVNGNSNKDWESSAPLTDSFLQGKFVRTVYKPVPLKYALDWPVVASYDELAGCAKWMGGRIPTMEEARSIYTYVNGMKGKDVEQQLGKTVPAVNGHLSNDGVEETPPSRGAVNGEGSQELFVDLRGVNVGFKNWHPVAVTADGNKLAGQAGMGGVWEWTSTTLAKHEGFEPMPLYPAYTADFFDGKHNIVLGGSWATHPRIAGRKSFVNWYQRNYLYPWAGARLVRDL